MGKVEGASRVVCKAHRKCEEKEEAQLEECDELKWSRCAALFVIVCVVLVFVQGDICMTKGEWECAMREREHGECASLGRRASCF